MAFRRSDRDPDRDLTWPGGRRIIGRRKFAYDLWGDTVNLASRLESSADAGQILVSQSVHGQLVGRFVFSDPVAVDLKGIGLTTAWFLRGTGGDVTDGAMAASAVIPSASSDPTALLD
jgi:class 3 adenylate cyclase